MTRRTRIYVAGPMLTSGNPYLNVRDGIRAGTALMKLGYVPFIPHLTAVWEIAAHEEFTYEDWLSMDFACISVSDAILRLPGDSRGADRETAYAASLNIPTFHSIEELQQKLPATTVEDLQRHHQVGAAIAAQYLREIAETGKHPAPFGAGDLEAAAQAILKLHRRVAG